MKRVALLATVAGLLLLPGVARAGGATDAALGLGAFAVFNQILSGTGIFGGVPAVAAPAPIVVPPPAPVVYVPPPRLVYVAPAPVYVPAPPVYVAPPPPVVYVPAPRAFHGHRVYYAPPRPWAKHGWDHRH